MLVHQSVDFGHTGPRRNPLWRPCVKHDLQDTQRIYGALVRPKGGTLENAAETRSNEEPERSAKTEVGWKLSCYPEFIPFIGLMIIRILWYFMAFMG